MRRCISAAQSRDQAGVLFKLAAKIVGLSPKIQPVIQIKETAKELHCAQLGTSYKALSAEVSTSFGLNPALMIFDELGQERGPRSALFEALQTAVGAQENPLTIIISTQAARDGDIMSILIDNALAGHDPSTVLRFSTAPVDADPFSEETIRLANPAYDLFMNKREVLAQAADAERMSASRAGYRNLVLNQRIETSSPFIEPSVWLACGDRPMDIRGCSVTVGVDLSSANDLTAVVVVHSDADTGISHVRPFFWLPADGLRDKAQHDHVPYDDWLEQGYLEVTPGASVQYEFIAERLKNIFDEHRVTKLAYAPWGFSFLKPCLVRVGFSDNMFEQTFVEFRQGSKTMTPALRATEVLCLDRKLRHGKHPILTMCMNNAVVEGDETARKLSKRRSNGRIDGAVALVMAIGIAPLTTTWRFDAAAMIG